MMRLTTHHPAQSMDIQLLLEKKETKTASASQFRNAPSKIMHTNILMNVHRLHQSEI